MKVLIKFLFIIIIASSLFIAVSARWVEFHIVKSILGFWLYKNIYLLYLFLNILLIIYLIFKKDLSKKEKQHYIEWIIAIPLYGIYVVLKVL